MELLPWEESLKLLLSRLDETHSQRKLIESELHRTLAEKRGEKRIQEGFKEFYWEEDYEMLWDVNLEMNEWKVQLDGLLVTERCAIIIESINTGGKITFNQETGEFYQIDDDGEKAVMEDPTFQMDKHIRFLTAWFKQRKITLPVQGLIVFTSENCEFVEKPGAFPICKLYQMHYHLHKLLQAHPQKTALFQLVKIKKLIELNTTPYERIPACTYFQINREDLLSGVYCIACNSHSMRRLHRTWFCTNCGGRDAAAHKLAIEEYFSLVDRQLTTQQFLHFCGIESRFVAGRMLAEVNLDTLGANKNRVYLLKQPNEKAKGTF
ncbi:nuclease-related domain-containing protein [Planococcus sp. YIM B11945]|uniref:nuclease-related domain-containing protein n=1 Tax=Planococcus sp. YIM B11945 TaxID=3435410 RepID=UPI003D7D8B39